jgi:hypothetical protein
LGVYTDNTRAYQLYDDGGNDSKWTVVNLCSTQTTCITYTNNTTSIVDGVDFTTCAGYGLENQSIGVGESICVKNGMINLKGTDYLTNEGVSCS